MLRLAKYIELIDAGNLQCPVLASMAILLYRNDLLFSNYTSIQRYAEDCTIHANL